MIRAARAEDALGIVEIYAPFCLNSATTFEVVPPSIDEMQRRMAAITKTHPWLVCEENGEILGYAYGCAHKERAAYRWSCDVAIYLAEKARGKGVGTMLYTELFRQLRELGLYNAYAGVTLPNAASVALHEKLGFKPVGVYKNVGYKLGKWHDVGWWHLILKEHDQEPDEPSRFQS